MVATAKKARKVQSNLSKRDANRLLSLILPKKRSITERVLYNSLCSALTPGISTFFLLGITGIFPAFLIKQRTAEKS